MTEEAAGMIEGGGGHDSEGGLLSWGVQSGRRLTENRKSYILTIVFKIDVISNENHICFCSFIKNLPNVRNVPNSVNEF